MPRLLALLALLALLTLSACNLRRPCTAADELDAIEAGRPTCHEERAARRAAIGRAFARSLADVGEGVVAGMPPVKYYTVTVGMQSMRCREDGQGNTDCQAL
jgi:hypothetical protein